jgi:ribokinase
MHSKKIIVVGSSNMDMVVRAERIPVPGETILSGSFFMNPGGKGANQAVAAARLGGDVTFVSKLGCDVFGAEFAQLFKAEGIDTSLLLSDKDHPSGVALITVDRKGENSIVVASGANAHLLVEDLEDARTAIASAGFLLIQLEIPIHTVSHVAAFAAANGVRVILNPAPAQVLTMELLRNIDILTPNETEASLISGIPVTDIRSAAEAAKILCGFGVKQVIVTMGAMGALICEMGNCSIVEAPRVIPVDTTAAGDVFNGALAVALSEGKNMHAAVQFACAAAAISVTRPGAQVSVPYRSEIAEEVTTPHR